MDQKNKFITFLLLSDIHLAYDNLKMIFEQEKNTKIDIILLLGDQDILNKQEVIEIENYKQHIQNLNKIFNIIDEFKKPIYYIPGNHDPQIFFNNKSKNRIEIQQEIDKLESQGRIIVEKREIEISKGLKLIGLGGSIDCRYNDDDIQWEGYPYDGYKEQEYNEYLLEIERVIEGSDDKFIVMSHIGPLMSQTSVDRKQVEGREIRMGSAMLQQVLERQKHKVLLNLHGHTHNGIGTDHILYSLPIINPGSVKDRNYALLTLHQHNQQFTIHHLSFLNIT